MKKPHKNLSVFGLFWATIPNTFLLQLNRLKNKNKK